MRAEESYRVLVDELPDPSRKKAGTVALVLRYSVPVFFRNPDAKAPDVVVQPVAEGPQPDAHRAATMVKAA